MGLFNRNKANRPQPTPRGAIIVLGILVIMGVAAKITGIARTPETSREEAEALDLYYRWDSAFVLDDVADADYTGSEEIDNAGDYFNASVPALRMEVDMCGELDRYVHSDADEKKMMIKDIRSSAERIRANTERRDTVLLAIIEKEIEWMERLRNGDTLGILEFRDYKTETAAKLDEAVKGKGWLMNYDVRFLRSGTKMRLQFACSERRDSLVLVSGKRIY